MSAFELQYACPFGSVLAIKLQNTVKLFWLSFSYCVCHKRKEKRNNHSFAKMLD